jgi:2',3'-cyclic-nucleotide 2'-phosphodiesterase/3'-nucleotidase
MATECISAKSTEGAQTSAQTSATTSAQTAQTSASAQTAQTTTLRLLQSTDVHGNFFPYNFITRKASAGSLARVAAAVKDVRTQAGDDAVILLDNGDILQGQPTVYYYNYVDTASQHIAARMLDYIGYDAGTIGNHDVETGRTVMDRWAAECAMPVLGANVVNTATGEPHFRPYTVIERQGIKIAVLGMITPGIPAWLPEVLWKGLRFDDMEETARKWLPIIEEREHPDVVVGLFHAGQAGNILVSYKENPSLEIAERVPGFDMVLMGHDHRVDKKWVVNSVGDSVLVINPANNAVHLTDITMTFTRDSLGHVTSKKIDGRIADMNAYEPDSAFMADFSPEMATIKAYVDAPIGKLTRTITTRDAYFGPSAFVDVIHELQLGITGADISFVAPLSYDATIPAGPITVSDMFNLYKYENMLYVMNLTGAEIKGYLERSYAVWTQQMKSPSDHLLLFSDGTRSGDQTHSKLKNASYNFDSAAGIIYEVDVTKPEGEKITIKRMADGSAFDPAKHYKVAVNSYRGNGGGELLTKGAGIPHDELPSRIITSTDRDLRFYLTEYIKKKGTVTPKALNQWKFVPESMVKAAAKRDRKALFNE